MGMVSELIVSVGVDGVEAVVGALKEVEGAQVKLKDNTSTQTQSMKMSWSEFTTGLNQGLQLAKTALDGINMAMGVVNDYSAYNLSMEQGSIATGMLSTEYSRLVQAADDAYVSQDKFTTSMEMATKNGYPITIASLGQIADKLNAIDNPADKAKAAMDIFGRGWADIMPFLDRGSVGINALTGNINKNLIATDESIAKSKAYATAVDDVNDNWTAAKNAAAAVVMPVLTKTLNDFTSFQQLNSDINTIVDAGVISRDEYSAAVLGGSRAINELYNSHVDEYNAQIKSTEALYAAQDAYDVNTTAVGAMTAQVDAAAIAQAQLDLEAAKVAFEFRQQVAAATGLTANFGNIINYAKNYTEIQKQINDKQAEYDKMPGWKQASADGKQLLSDIEKLKQGYTDLANQMTLDMFQATIAIGGVTDAEMGAYLDMAVEMGFISQEGADAATDAYNAAIGKINAMGIDEKTGNVVVDAAAAFAAFDLIEAYAFADKTVRIQMVVGAGLAPGPGDQEAIGGPVYPGNVYNWQEPGGRGKS